MHRKLSFHPGATADLSLAEDLALCARLGLRRTSLSMKKMTAAGPIAGAVQSVKNSGLAVDFVTPEFPGFMLAHPDSWPETRDSMFAAMEVAAELGAKAIFTAGGSGQGMAYELAAKAFALAIAPVLDALRKRGIRLFLEPVRPQFAYVGFIHTFRDGVALARQHRIELAFDLAHCWWEPGLEALLLEARDLIGTIQLGDLDFSQPITVRVNLGDGQLPIARLLQAAIGPSYDGAFDLELIGPAIAAEGYEAAFRRAGAYVGGMLPS